MVEVWDPSEICRDEDCTRRDVHRKHLVQQHAPPKPHHRPDPSKKPLWERNDPRGLTGAVARATSKSFPRIFQEIVRDVIDDYGNVTVRSVHRHVKKLVERNQLVKLDLGFTFAIYIRPKSHWLEDLEGLKEFVLGELEFGRSCVAEQRYDDDDEYEEPKPAKRKPRRELVSEVTHEQREAADAYGSDFYVNSYMRVGKRFVPNR